MKDAIKLYKGSWVNKKENRHLSIRFDTDGRVTINEWVGRYKAGETDIYTAYIKNSILIVPEDTEHTAPYCEISNENKNIIYRCRSSSDTSKSFVSRKVFTKSK